MNHFVLSARLFTVTALAVSWLALIHRPRSRIHRIFAAYWFSIAFWSATVGWQARLIPLLSAFWWGWWLHAGCIFIPTLLLHFAFEFTRERTSRWVLRVMYGTSWIYLLLNTWTTLFTHGTAFRDAYAYPTPAVFYPLYFVTFVVSVVYGTLLFVRAKSRLGPARGRGLRNYWIAQLLGYTGGMDNFAIMADLRLFPLYPYGLYLGVAYALVALSGRVSAMTRPRKVLAHLPRA